MDCQAARLLLWFKRPQGGDLLPDDDAALAVHLASCPSCDRLARLQAQENRVLGRAMRAVPVPVALKDRLLAHLDKMSRQSGRARVRRRVLYGAGALCAVVLLAALGLWLVVRPRPPASLQELDWWTRSRFSLPTQCPATDKIAWLEQYFYSNGLWFRVPSFMKAQWDFTDLTAAYVEDFSRDRIAVMEFKKNDAHAFVFVLPSERCDPDEAKQYAGQSASALVVRSDTDDGFVAFVTLKEGTLDHFLRKDADHK